ncbi:MAG: GSCFA domain-containing protein, partial [Burkholderiales bacterium]|nr:GSCFA domain-containing protein [Flavobacterium sp.]
QQAIEETLAAIRGVNPNVHVVLTVSPVRHLKDGFTENQQSKSNIISALHQAIRQFPAMADYFPSYEIMIDELRDYRFYAQDMVHPNAMAIEYIWEKFSQTYVSQEGQLILKQVAVIQQGLHHRPFHPHTESHQQFLANLQHKIMLLQQQFPRISF